jgi:hypothetical protein
MSETPQILGLHIETAKFLLSSIAILGGLGAFVAGLIQYRSAQLWRRKEFIGREIKNFLDDRVVHNALLMIDWNSRRIPFDAAAPREIWPKVTRETQIAALEPHSLRPNPAEPEPNK